MRILGVLALAFAVLLFALWPAVLAGAAASEVRLDVLPVNCVFEVVDDGSNTIRYLTPAECGAAKTAFVPDDTGLELQPTSDASVPPAQPFTSNPQQNAGTPHLQTGTSSLVLLCPAGSTQSENGCAETSLQTGEDAVGEEALPIIDEGTVLHYNLVMLSIGAAVAASIVVDAIFFRLSMTKTGAVCVGNFCKRIGGLKNKSK